MKYTLCITQQCNLNCNYCYIGKKKSTMALPIAEKIVDFIFANSPKDEKIDIGFFGGEPFLKFEQIKEITELIKLHPSFNDEWVELSVTTNGTIFSEEIANYINIHNIKFCISCDGPSFVQDKFRCFPNGMGSSSLVEDTIRQSVDVLPYTFINAVYHPLTFQHLPTVIDYLSSLGIRQIYLNPDFSASWNKKNADLLPEIYDEIAQKYISYHLEEKPHFISLIDSKITVILRGGYKPIERCRMGKGELAFAPSGNIYPCERLIGCDDGVNHCLGNINNGFSHDGICKIENPGKNINNECQFCSLSDYCMNWCGCSNYFSSGDYNTVGPFLCASEKTSILSAFRVFQSLEKKMGTTFYDHLSGTAFMKPVERNKNDKDTESNK